MFQGLRTVCGAGDAKSRSGIGVHMYTCNTSMVDRWECICTQIMWQKDTFSLMKSISSLPLISFFPPLFQVLQQLRRRLSDWWGKRAVVVFTVIYHKNNDSSSISLPSCSNFLLSVPFFVCLCVQSPSRERSWSPPSLGRWWSSRTRSVSSRWALCFPSPLVFKEIFHCVCPNIPLTIFREALFGAFWKWPQK